MPLTIKVEYPESLKGSGKIEQIEKMKSSILMEGGKALQDLLKQWMRDLDSARSTHGSNFYTPYGIHNPTVEDDTVSVGIAIPGITRALHDIVISPVEAKQLAIPVNEEAYGIPAREYTDRHPKTLFKPKGKDWLAKKDDSGNLVLMYILKDQVHQNQDASLLPSQDEMMKTVYNAISDVVETILGM